MRHLILILITLFSVVFHANAQMEPHAGKWKTWFISSGKDYRLPAPPSYKQELAQVVTANQNLDAAGIQQILYWNAGAPGYRWQEMLSKLWVYDTSNYGVLANMLLGTAIYDATIAGWDTKYAFNRPRPYILDGRIKMFVPKPESPSYPCEYSIAAGVASAIFGRFYPSMADSVNKMAQKLMTSRIAAGLAFPGDTKAGFELGKRIAEKEIERTADYSPKTAWDQKIPQGPGLWNGKYPMFVMAGKSKTVVLDSASQYRPGPPPDFAKEMVEMKNYKQTFRSQVNAFYYASAGYSDDPVHRKLFEYNLHLNPPRAARIYAAQAIASYDAFVACWDAKYTYWGMRPDQYDTTFKPLIPTPPFPGYPSGHAVMGGTFAELNSYFFPADKALFDKRAKDGAESRFQGGIHFRTDNEVGTDLGRKVGSAIVRKLKTDGADEELPSKKSLTKTQ